MLQQILQQILLVVTVPLGYVYNYHGFNAGTTVAASGSATINPYAGWAFKSTSGLGMVLPGGEDLLELFQL